MYLLWYFILYIVEVYCKIFIVIYRKKMKRIITEKLISNRSSFQATIFSHILNTLNLPFTQTCCAGLGRLDVHFSTRFYKCLKLSFFNIIIIGALDEEDSYLALSLHTKMNSCQQDSVACNNK